MSQKKTRNQKMDYYYRRSFRERLEKADECQSFTPTVCNSSRRSKYEELDNNAEIDNDYWDNLATSEDQESTKTSWADLFDIDIDIDPYKKRVTHDSDRYRDPEIFSYLSWSYLYSNATRKQFMTWPFESIQEEYMQVKEAIDMMQHISLNDFKKLCKPVKFKSTCSVAKHMATITNQRLSSVELVTAAVRNCWFDNLELKIDRSFARVDRYLFRHYMGRFQNLTKHCLELPCHKVKMSQMVKLYNWIISNDNKFRLGRKVLSLYNTSKFLEVRYILKNYWTMFSLSGKTSILPISEGEAFQAYIPNRQMQSVDLKPIFLSRISKCFLPVVASIEFVTLGIDEVIYILKMDKLCVNSEDEVFFAAIRWLEFNWREREKHLVKLMAALRFRYLSPWLQYSIEYCPENYIISQVGANQTVKAMLWQACLINEATSAYHECPDAINDIQVMRYSRIPQVDRYWASCKGIAHYHNTNCPRFRPLTYGTFKLFLNEMHDKALIFMESLEDFPYKQWHSYICCNKFLSVKDTDAGLRKVMPFFYRLN